MTAPTVTLLVSSSIPAATEVRSRVELILSESAIPATVEMVGTVDTWSVVHTAERDTLTACLAVDALTRAMIATGSDWPEVKQEGPSYYEMGAMVRA